MLQHLLGMEVRDEERNIVSLGTLSAALRGQGAADGGGAATHLDGLPPQNEEGLGSLGQEAGELVDQDVLDLVGLLDLDAYPHAVDAGFDEDTLVLVTGHDEGV